jgi:hypothetical protein
MIGSLVIPIPDGVSNCFAIGASPIAENLNASPPKNYIVLRSLIPNRARMSVLPFM